MLSQSPLIRCRELWVFVWVTIVFVSPVAGAQAEHIPQLKSQAYLLYPTQLDGYDEESNTLQFDSALSRDGRYVVGITTMYQMAEFHAYLQLWDTSRFAISNRLEQIPPHATYDLGVNGERPTISLSADEQYAAVLIGRKLNIFSLPALEPYWIALIDNMEVDDVLWSTDGRLIGILTDTQLVVYDLKTHDSYMQLMPEDRHLAKYSPRKIESMGTGWLYLDQNDQVFTVCQWHLESCNSYQLQEELRILPAPDGNQILGLHNPLQKLKTIKRWSFQGGTEYQAADDLAFLSLFEAEFSPTGNYIAGYQYYSPNESITLVIYDFDQLRRVFVADTGQLPTWFLNEKFFLIVNSDLLLNLYRIDSATPLQTLDLNSIDTAAVLNEPIKFRTSDNLSIQLAEKGDKALITFDYSALLLPISLE